MLDNTLGRFNNNGFSITALYNLANSAYRNGKALCTLIGYREDERLIQIILLQSMGRLNIIGVVGSNTFEINISVSFVVAQLHSQNQLTVLTENRIKRGNVDIQRLVFRIILGIFDILGICIVYTYRLAPNLCSIVHCFKEHTHNSRTGRTVLVFLVFGIEDSNEISGLVNNADITVVQHSGCFGQQFFGTVNTKTFILIVDVIVHQLAIVIFYRSNSTGGVEFGSRRVLICRNTLFVHYTVGAIRQISILIYYVVNLIAVDFDIDDCGKSYCYGTCCSFAVFYIRYPNGVCVCTVYMRGVGVIIKNVVGGNTEDIIIGILSPCNNRGALVCCHLYSILIITCCFSVYNCVLVGFAGIDCIQTICELNALHRQSFCTGVGVDCFFWRKLLGLLRVCNIEIAIVLKEGIGGIAESVIVYNYGSAPFTVIPLRVAKLYAVVLIIIVFINGGSKIDFVICSAKVDYGSIFITVCGICVTLVSQIHSGFLRQHTCGIRFCFFCGYFSGPNFKLFLVPQNFNVCTKFACNLPRFEIKFGENVKNKFCAETTVNSDRSNRTTHAERGLNSCFYRYLELLQLYTVVKFQLQENFSANGYFNFKCNRNYPNNKL